MYKVVPNKSFGQVLDISSKCFIFLKTFDSEFSYIELWFTDQNSKSLEIEDKVNITLVINYVVKYKKCTTQSNLEMQYLQKVMDFYLLLKNIGKNVGKNISKNLSVKYSQKRLDHANTFATDTLKTTSKTVIQKTAEATGDLIGNKILMQ